MKGDITALRSEVNKLAATVKVIMMALGKGLLEGGSSERKDKEKVLKPKPDAKERNAQKTEVVGKMEQNVVASYTEEASLVARWKLCGLRQEGSLRDYVKEFTTIV